MHLLHVCVRAAAVVFCMVALALPRHANAGVLETNYLPNWMPMPRLVVGPPLWMPPVPPPGGGEVYSPSQTATYEMSNIGGYSFPACEPNPSGLMTKTQWGAAAFQQAGRVVVHTFGSDFDTVLAAYRGSSCGALTLLGVNDNRLVSGISTSQSLLQFDVAANTQYRLQIGGRNGAEGDIYANIFRLPVGGGLSVFLARYGGASFEGRDYVCELGYTHASTCPAATFVVHNSTSQTLTVTPSTNLGGAFVLPAAFSLGPGQAKAVNFAYNAAFNRTTLRTVVGYFTFSGRVGTTLVSRAHSRGLISVKSQTGYGPNVLRAAVANQVRTAYVNEGAYVDVKLSNIGAQAATGCHARSKVYSRLKTYWREFTPPSTLGTPSVPVTIPAGGSKWLRVWMASQTGRDGDPLSLGDVIIDCANTAELAFNAANRFDLTSFGSFPLRNVAVVAVSPTNGVLNVPATGTAKFRVSVKNTGAAAQMRVNGLYEGPYDDPANSRFTVTSICAANAAGACIGPNNATALIYSAPQNVTRYFNVFVRAPAVNPGYDASKRRIFLNVKQDAPANVATDYVLVGTRGIAVRKN